MTGEFYPRSKWSMLVFGGYLMAVGGVGLGIYPHLTLSLMGMKASDETFVRLVGLLAFIIGVNYFLMVHQGAVIFFKLSTLMRYFAGLFMCILVFTGVSPINLLLLALGDIAGATWTLFSLREDERRIKKH